MEPHQQRVVDEKRELDEKLSKLATFFNTPVFHGLDPDEQERLIRQASCMGEYTSILSERIAAF